MSNFKRARMDGISQFLDMEAGVDDDSEEYESESDEEAYFIEDEADDTVRPLEFERTYGLEAEEHASAEAQKLAASLQRRSRLESAQQESKVAGGVYWMVPVRVGKEEDIAAELSKSVGSDVTCIADPWLKGRIYVRVPKDLNPVSMLRHLGSTVKGAYVHRKIVPISGQEEDQLVERAEMRPNFSVRYAMHTWVKIRYGVFAGDIAYVQSSSEDSDMLQVLVVPRISVDGRKHSLAGRLKSRGPQMLFEPDMIVKNMDRVVQPGRIPGSWLVDNEEEYLSNGLRVLNVTGIHYVKHYRPSAEELQLFTIAGVDTIQQTNEAFLGHKDRVKFVKGGFVGCKGLVVSKEEENVRIRSVMSDGIEEGEEMLVRISEVVRILEIGSSIVIRLGLGKGRRGMIVDVLAREVVMLENDTREEWCVLQDFVELDEEYRNRIIPTLGRMKEAAQAVPGRKHVALGKIVYVIPEQRFTRIIGVQECGTRFRVEQRKGKYDAKNPGARNIKGLGESVGQMEEGEIEGDSEYAKRKEEEFFTNLQITRPMGEGQIWEARHLLATDAWVTLENGRYERTEEVQELFRSFVDLRPQETRNIRYIDTLRTVSHPVFVSDGNFKTFGSFVGTNGKGSAFVTFENKQGRFSLDANEVISMLTLRRLDGSPAGNMKAVVSRYKMRMGTDRTRRGKDKGKRRENEGGTASKQVSLRTVMGCACDVLHEENPCAFVFDDRFQGMIQTHHVMFRFRVGCKEPRNVDGKFAWTTKETEVRRGRCDVRLMYKTKDNVVARHEYVPVNSLEPCVPLLKEDEALVLRGEDAWKVVFPSHNAKDVLNTKTGMYCKMSVKAKKKDSKLFDLKSITRIRELEKGQPIA